MTSRTEAIALRLWKLKAAAIDLDMIKNYTVLQPPQHPTSPPPHHHQATIPRLPPPLISSDEEDRRSLSSRSNNSNTPSPLGENAPQFFGEPTANNNNNISSRQTTGRKHPSALPSLLTNQTAATTETSKKNEDLKPTQSYIALIATAILKSKDKRLVLSDIYKHILDNYSYFQSQDKSWRNSIRHNLSLNECFIKVGRSELGKGHYWAIHPANYDDFSQGDFRRRRARRRVRRSFLDHHHPYTGYPLRPYANLSSAHRPSPSSHHHIYRADSYNSREVAVEYQHLAESFLMRSGVDRRRDYEENKGRHSVFSPARLRLRSREYTNDIVAGDTMARFKSLDQQEQRQRISPPVSNIVIIHKPNHSLTTCKKTSVKAAAFTIDSLLAKDRCHENNSNLKRKDRRASDDNHNIDADKNKDSIIKSTEQLKLLSEEQRSSVYRFPFYYHHHPRRDIASTPSTIELSSKPTTTSNSIAS